MTPVETASRNTSALVTFSIVQPLQVSSNSTEYASLLCDQFSEEILINFCVSGRLRSSNLRSVAWKIQLKCLPITKNEWASVSSRTRRQYEVLKKKNISNPYDDVFSQDPQYNNPLDQTDHSPWQRYFADSELRDIITKDVDRTFPETEFFQQAHIRRMMSDILLIYAKENPFLSYKQGMHEILAPLMFVLYSDSQSYEHFSENGGLRDISDSDRRILDIIYDTSYLEHDSFSMFCEMMLEVSKWYEEGIQISPNKVQKSESSPFMRIQDATPTSILMSELSAIGERLFSIDPKLAKHLSALDVAPQLYGIRWLRLLFGREFAIHDLLYVWDVFICDRPIDRMVECVFLAMLVHIRDLCESVIYHRPAYSAMTNFSHITVAGTSHPNKVTRGGDVLSYEEPPSGLRPKSTSVLAKMRSSVFDRAAMSVPNTPHTTPRKLKPKAGSNHQSQSPSWETVRIFSYFSSYFYCWLLSVYHYFLPSLVYYFSAHYMAQ
uniref:Rab-GAP TBC domain-containing protein n=1 Tax=Heterorhabditis bacteriophora TaxID=37862 RepID=A0A1I7XDI6_HETBA